MSDEEKKEIAEEAGKRLIWDLLGSSEQLHNLSSYARLVTRKAEDCRLYRIMPSKDLIVRYGISYDVGYISFVWWLLEQFEKGNITIKKDEIQPIE